MKYFSEYLVAATLAFGVLMLAAIDVHAAVVCGPNGCHRDYPHRSQWPVGQSGKYYEYRALGLRHVRWPAGLSLTRRFSPQTYTLILIKQLPCSAPRL